MGYEGCEDITTTEQDGARYCTLWDGDMMRANYEMLGWKSMLHLVVLVVVRWCCGSKGCSLGCLAASLS